MASITYIFLQLKPFIQKIPIVANIELFSLLIHLFYSHQFLQKCQFYHPVNPISLIFYIKAYLKILLKIYCSIYIYIYIYTHIYIIVVIFIFNKNQLNKYYKIMKRHCFF